MMNNSEKPKKINIFKTFEIFLREPLSILKDRLIQIVNLSTDFAEPPSVNVDFLNSKTQITVVNSEKMYNLLKTVQHRREEKAVQHLTTSAKKNQIVLGQLFGRT